MVVQIDTRTERTGTLRGQLKNGPARACNTCAPGLATNALGGIVTRDHSSNSSSCESHRRNQLALSILDHRGSTPEAVAAAIAALEGESLPSLTLRGA